MAQGIPKVTIQLQNYNKPVIYLNLTLSQNVGGHHHFSFIWNVGEVKSNENFQLDIIKNNIGKIVNIEIGDNLFKGVITRILVQDQNSKTQTFHVSGQSLTILLDDVPKSASYYRKDLAKIVNSTLENIPENVLPKEVKPSNKESQCYITQYNETDFQFLQRLSSRYGQWFYFDGLTLNFGSVQHSGLKLKNVADVNNFMMSASLQATQFGYKAYDYHQGDVIDKESGKLDTEVKNDYSIASADSSNELFSRKDERSMHNFNTINKKMVEDMSQLEHDRIDAQLVSISGDTKIHGIKVGYIFDVETLNGTYDVIPISITHFSSVVGHYQNTFIGIPGTSKVPPYTDPHIYRKAEAQSAKVVENHDKDGLNRIKVRFPWQKSTETTPWIRLAATHAGQGKGFHFIPEKEEEVVIDFEGSDVDKPYATSTIFNNKAKSGQGDPDNNIKSIITRSGNTIRFNDKEGSITILDAKGSTIVLNGDETIEITSKKKITVSSKDIELKAENNISLNAKSNINLHANGNINASAGGTLEAKASKAINLKSSTDKIAVEGLQDVSVKSGAGAVNIEAMTEFKAKGTVGATVEGLKLDLKGTAMASLQAALVKIN
jgi:uncharacterized protein involved in type VI secretion and phage assembly